MKRNIDGWEIRTSVEPDDKTGALRACLWAEHAGRKVLRLTYVKSFPLDEEVQANDFIGAHLYSVVGVNSDGSLRTG